MISSATDLYISGRNPIHDVASARVHPHPAHLPDPLSIRTDNLSPLAIDEDTLPRLSAVKSKADDFLHHLDVLKEATRMTIAGSLVDHPKHARLRKSEKVMLLESLVERGREVGDGRPLDQLVESVLDDIRSSWSAAFASNETANEHLSPTKCLLSRPHSAAVTRTADPASPSKLLPSRARKYNSSETEQALKSLEAFKKKIRKMKAQGLKVDTVLDQPSIMKTKPSLSARPHQTIVVAPVSDTGDDRAELPIPPPGTPLAAWELEPRVSGMPRPSSSRIRECPQPHKIPKDADDEAHMHVKFVARPVPPSSLVPKFDMIMRQAEERRKQRVQQVKHELQGQIKPFAFEYSTMLQKRREATKAKRLAESNVPKRKPPTRPKSALGLTSSSPRRTPKPRPPSSHDPTPDHTFRPHINTTIPDFSASHMHFASQLARWRKSHAPPTPRPFRGVEMRQRVFEERKKRTLARVMIELNKDERPSTGTVGKAPSVETIKREAGPAPKTTRATELTLAARKAKETARAKRAEDERMAQAHREAKEAAMAAVIRDAMDSAARKRMVRGVAAAGKRDKREREGVRTARRQMATATREYATFLEAMEARLSARPLTLEQVGDAQGPSVREQAKKVAEEKITKILADLELDSPESTDK